MIVNLAILLEWIRVRLSSGSFFNYVDNVGRGTENVNNTQIFSCNSKIILTSIRGEVGG
jgi:hypothetical protein